MSDHGHRILQNFLELAVEWNVKNRAQENRNESEHA